MTDCTGVMTVHLTGLGWIAAFAAMTGMAD